MNMFLDAVGKLKSVVGFANIGIAVLIHEGSTLLVVANALRLLAYNNKKIAFPGGRIKQIHELKQENDVRI